jgi:hypothetical protein
MSLFYRAKNNVQYADASANNESCAITGFSSTRLVAIWFSDVRARSTRLPGRIFNPGGRLFNEQAGVNRRAGMNDSQSVGNGLKLRANVSSTYHAQAVLRGLHPCIIALSLYSRGFVWA